MTARTGRFLRSLLTGLLLQFAHPSAAADERRLLVVDAGGGEHAFTVAELSEEFGLREVAVHDPQYGELRRFRGVPLRPLLARLELSETDLVLECIDGYRIALPADALADPGLEPVLAFADSEPTPGHHWRLYPHGRELVDFDPFYLVWQVRDKTLALEAAEAKVARLPWPYQMTRVVPGGAYTLPPPGEGAPAAARLGHATYADHCLKCHSLQGVGGLVGPPLDRAGGLAASLDAGELRHLIRRVTDFFPQTKMPVYEDVLGEGELDALVAYLRWVNPRDDRSH